MEFFLKGTHICPGPWDRFQALGYPVSPEGLASVTGLASPVSPSLCQLACAHLTSECLSHDKSVLLLCLAQKKLHSFISLPKVISLLKPFCLETLALDESFKVQSVLYCVDRRTLYKNTLLQKWSNLRILLCHFLQALKELAWELGVCFPSLLHILSTEQ